MWTERAPRSGYYYSAAVVSVLIHIIEGLSIYLVVQMRGTMKEWKSGRRIISERDYLKVYIKVEFGKVRTSIESLQENSELLDMICRIRGQR
jgi:hypothetical protein